MSQLASETLFCNGNILLRDAAPSDWLFLNRAAAPRNVERLCEDESLGAGAFSGAHIGDKRSSKRHLLMKGPVNQSHGFGSSSSCRVWQCLLRISMTLRRTCLALRDACVQRQTVSSSRSAASVSSTFSITAESE